jgi:low affinity Fe/Cu permease
MAPRNRFDRFAEAASRAVGRSAFFSASVVAVVLWLPLIFVFESVDTWQLVINTATSVMAFLLIALLQNSENRNDAALHRKLDVLAVALADHLEAQGGGDPTVAALRDAVGIERRA